MRISLKDLSKSLTEEEKDDLEALEGRTIIYDEDSPELTIEQIRQFKRTDGNNNDMRPLDFMHD